MSSDTTTPTNPTPAIITPETAVETEVAAQNVAASTATVDDVADITVNPTAPLADSTMPVVEPTVTPAVVSAEPIDEKKAIENDIHPIAKTIWAEFKGDLAAAVLWLENEWKKTV